MNFPLLLELSDWLKDQPAVLKLVEVLREVDGEENNAGAASFWAGYLWACLVKERERMARGEASETSVRVDKAGLLVVGEDGREVALSREMSEALAQTVLHRQRDQRGPR